MTSDWSRFGSIQPSVTCASRVVAVAADIVHLTQAMAAVRSVLSSADGNRLQSALDELAHTTQPLAELLMNDVLTATLKDGREIQGVARSYSNYSLGVLDAKGKMHLLASQDVAKVTFRRESMMPGDYAKRLSAAEIENVLAFLSRQTAGRNTE